MPEPAIITKLDLSELQPGRHDLWFRAAETGIGTPIDLPIVVLKGSPGRCVYLQAGLHGDELAGVAVIHHLLDELAEVQLSGTIVAIPCANPTGMLAHSRQARAASEGLTLTDLNREMPGQADSRNPNTRFAHALWDRLYAGQPDVFLDLHTMTHGNNFPFFVFADRRDPAVDRLVRLVPADQIKDDPGEPGSVETEMVATGVPAMTLELGASKTFDPDLTRRGLQAVRNILIDQKVIQGKPDMLGVTPFAGSEEINIRAARGGFVDMHVALNEPVAQGTLLATQHNAFGHRVADYTAPEAGRVLSIATDPMREPGALLVKLLK